MTYDLRINLKKKADVGPLAQIVESHWLSKQKVKPPFGGATPLKTNMFHIRLLKRGHHFKNKGSSSNRNFFKLNMLDFGGGTIISVLMYNLTCKTNVGLLGLSDRQA